MITSAEDTGRVALLGESQCCRATDRIRTEKRILHLWSAFHMDAMISRPPVFAPLVSWPGWD